MCIVKAKINDKEIFIGNPFPDEDKSFIERLIQFPVSTQYGMISPENMRIEQVTEDG